MKNLIYLFFIIVSTFVNAQTNQSDYFCFYKGGNCYAKPIKYVLFDSSKGHKKKEIGSIIYFYMDSQTFIFDSKTHKTNTSNTNLSKFTLSNPSNLQTLGYEFYKKTKHVEEKKMNLKTPLIYPLKNFCLFFKIFVLEKTNQTTLLQHEVDWKYSTF